MTHISIHQSENKNAPIIVLFGGSPIRRNEVIDLFLEVTDCSIYGALSEDEGIEMINQLNAVDLVLIGGRYSENQRINIRNYVKQKFPDIKITEPGWDYEYTNENIKTDIKTKLNL